MLRSCSQNSFNQLLSFKIFPGRESVLSQNELLPARSRHPLHGLLSSLLVCCCFVCLSLKFSHSLPFFSLHFEKLEREEEITKNGMADFHTEILAFYQSASILFLFKKKKKPMVQIWLQCTYRIILTCIKGLNQHHAVQIISKYCVIQRPRQSRVY